MTAQIRAAARRRLLTPGCASLAAAVALAGCGQADDATSTTIKTTTNPSGTLGSALRVTDSSGTILSVTVERVIDPAPAASGYSHPAAGTHFAGVELSVKNTAGRTYQNNANNETTVTLSNGVKLPADYNPIAGCGNFDNGQITLSSDASKTGCVTFQIPNGQTVAAVRYGNTVFPGTTAIWQVQ